MFDFEPITTSNVITVVQILVVVAGFFFSWRSLEATRASITIATANLATAATSLGLATSNAQAQLYNQMVLQGRDLQYKFMEIFYGGKTPEDEQKRRDLYTGVVIAYYAACFELRKVLALPESVEKLLNAELKELMRQTPFRNMWDGVKHLHSKEFIAHVNSLAGV